MATKPELGIKNPYALDDTQFAAAVDLLKKQKPVIGHYWVDYTKQMEAFTNKDAVIGTTWEVITNLLKAADPAGAGRGRQAQGGRDGLVRHLDDQLQDQAHQLRLQVHRAHRVADGERADRRVVRRGARATARPAPRPRIPTTATTTTPTTTPSGRTSGTGRRPRRSASTAAPTRPARASTTGSRPGRRSRAEQPLGPSRPGRGPADRRPPSSRAPAADERGRRRPGAGARAGAGGGSPASCTGTQRSGSAGCSPAPVGWLGIVYLGSLVDPVPQRVLAARRVHRARDPRVHARELRRDPDQPDLPPRDAADGRHGGGRHGHLRAAGVPHRLLHGPRREPADEGPAGRRRPHAALGELPRQGVHVAPDPLGRRRAQLGARAVRAQRARGSATR